MKISLVIGAAVLAQQSQACVAVTIKEDLAAGQYNWTVWKDGHKEAAFHEKGVRPRIMFGDVNDQDYWVTLDGDFHEMTGHVKKLSYSEFQWNPYIWTVEFENYGDKRRTCLHGGENCANRPCGLP